VLGAFAFLTFILVSSMIYGVRFGASENDMELPTQYPLVYVYPNKVTADVNETFTISVIVYNLTDAEAPNPVYPTRTVPLGNLYGFDIQFSWDPTIIQYVNHTVTVTVEDYPDPVPPSPYPGVLHEPIVEVANLVNETGNIPGAVDPRVRAWFAYASMSPAEPYPISGNGTLFTMTFKVLKKGESPLEIVYCTLSDKDGNAIAKDAATNTWLNPPRSGVFRLGAPVADFTYWPDVGVVNKTMYFNASVTENLTNIETYMWNFGDGTKLNTTTPLTQYTYNTSDTYTVSLKVIDKDGVESANVTKDIVIAEYRDLEVASVDLSQNMIKPNTTLTVTSTVYNLGEGPSFMENCTLFVYYNASTVDWQDLSNTTWTPLNTTNTSIEKDHYKRITFNLNSSNLPAIEAHYYFLANATGIPKGYENNTENNIKISDALYYTNKTVHNPAITDFAFGYLRSGAVGKPTPPVIEGENTTFYIVVKNQGTDLDLINVTLYANGSTILWETFNIPAGESVTINDWTYKLNAGYHNLTVEAKAGDVSDSVSGMKVPKVDLLKVIKPPKLVVTYTPEEPALNQEVVFNASESLHQDIEGNITLYTWEIYGPGWCQIQMCR